MAAICTHPATGTAAASTQGGAATDEDASEATLQSLLAGALASADAAAGGSEPYSGRTQQQPSAPVGSVPWLPLGPLSSWHGYLGSPVLPRAPLQQLQAVSFDGRPLAGALAYVHPAQGHGLPGAVHAGLAFRDVVGLLSLGMHSLRKLF